MIDATHSATYRTAASQNDAFTSICEGGIAPLPADPKFHREPAPSAKFPGFNELATTGYGSNPDTVILAQSFGRVSASAREQRMSPPNKIQLPSK